MSGFYSGDPGDEHVERPKKKEENEYVYAHDGFCNDYTGCNDGCGWIKKSEAEVRMGAWRRAKVKESNHES